MHKQVVSIFSVIALLAASGCESPGPERIGEQNPTVTYAYKPGEAEQTKQDAAKYCHERFNRAARILNDKPRGGERVMTVECVVKR